MSGQSSKQKTVIIGAGPVGALAALYAAQRGDDVEIYELRSGTLQAHYQFSPLSVCNAKVYHIRKFTRNVSY